MNTSHASLRAVTTVTTWPILIVTTYPSTAILLKIDVHKKIWVHAAELISSIYTLYTPHLITHIFSIWIRTIWAPEEISGKIWNLLEGVKTRFSGITFFQYGLQSPNFACRAYLASFYSNITDNVRCLLVFEKMHL